MERWGGKCRGGAGWGGRWRGEVVSGWVLPGGFCTSCRPLYLFSVRILPEKYKLLPTLPSSHSFRLSNSLFFFFLLWVGGGGDAGNKQMRLSFKRN